MFIFDKLSKKWRLLLLAVCTMLFLIIGTTSKLSNSLQAIAQTPANTQTNAAVYHFNVGNFKAVSVSDGNLKFLPSAFIPNAG